MEDHCHAEGGEIWPAGRRGTLQASQNCLQDTLARMQEDHCHAQGEELWHACRWGTLQASWNLFARYIGVHAGGSFSHRGPGDMACRPLGNLAGSMEPVCKIHWRACRRIAVTQRARRYGMPASREPCRYHRIDCKIHWRACRCAPPTRQTWRRCAPPGRPTWGCWHTARLQEAPSAGSTLIRHLKALDSRSSQVSNPARRPHHLQSVARLPV